MSTPMYDMPEHFPIGVNAQGQGPVMPNEPDYDHEECWCGTEGCTKHTEQVDYGG